MKLMFIAVMSLLSISPLCIAEEPDPVEQSILDELKAIRDSLTNIESELKLIRDTQTKLTGLPEKTVTTDPLLRRGIDTNKLAQIVLPEFPTDDEIRLYIRQVLDGSDKQGSYASTDPQIAMLEKLGATRVRLLVDALRNTTDASGRFYLREVILQLGNDDHKELIISALADDPNLAQAIVKNGWEEDARDVLLQPLEKSSSVLSYSWLEAVANLNDPETYPALKNYLVYGRNRHLTLQVMQRLPGIDVSQEIPLAWENARKEGGIQADYMAIAAADLGITDALGYLIENLKPEEDNSKLAMDQRSALGRLIFQRGSSEEIKAWYDQNKDVLFFDVVLKKFRVKKAEEL